MTALVRANRLMVLWSIVFRLLRLRLRYGDLLRVPRVEHYRDEAGLHLARVLRDAVEAPGRLVVDPQLVLAFQDVPEPQPRVSVRHADRRTAKMWRAISLAR